MPDRRTFIASSAAVAAAAFLPRMAIGAPLAPFKVFDTHAHVHAADLSRYPYRVDIEAPRRERAVARPVTPEVLFKSWDAAGIDMGCAVQFNALYSTDNRYLLDVAEGYPKRVSPVVILSPTDAGTPAALQAMAKAYGISGVRFSGPPLADGSFPFLGDAALRSWATAEELGLIVVLMPMMSDQPKALPAAMKRVGELARKFPRLTIVMDHFGFPVAERTPTFGFSPEHLALAEHRNVHHKYTTFLLEVLRRGGVPDKDFFNYAVGAYGTERVIWGSDFGNTPGEMYDFLKRALASASDLTPAQTEAIFSTNARKMFKPGGRTTASRGA